MTTSFSRSATPEKSSDSLDALHSTSTSTTNTATSSAKSSASTTPFEPLSITEQDNQQHKIMEPLSMRPTAKQESPSNNFNQTTTTRSIHNHNYNHNLNHNLNHSQQKRNGTPPSSTSVAVATAEQMMLASHPFLALHPMTPTAAAALAAGHHPHHLIPMMAYAGTNPISHVPSNVVPMPGQQSSSNMAVNSPSKYVYYLYHKSILIYGLLIVTWIIASISYCITKVDRYLDCSLLQR
jgi:hypothetical protein